jgi:hypothetical protein
MANVKAGRMEGDMKSEFINQKRRAFVLILVVGVACVLAAYCLLPTAYFLKAAPAPVNVQPRPLGVVTDTPAITIAGATADTTATPTTSAREAQIQWVFGTVTGSYSTCTVQAKTSYDGTNYLTLGTAASVTVSSNAVNAWTVIEQLGTTSVTTSTVSSTAALGFGQLTKYTFACSGGYGTSAPVTVSVIYR